MLSNLFFLMASVLFLSLFSAAFGLVDIWFFLCKARYFYANSFTNMQHSFKPRILKNFLNQVQTFIQFSNRKISMNIPRLLPSFGERDSKWRNWSWGQKSSILTHYFIASTSKITTHLTKHCAKFIINRMKLTNVHLTIRFFCCKLLHFEFLQLIGRILYENNSFLENFTNFHFYPNSIVLQRGFHTLPATFIFFFPTFLSYLVSLVCIILPRKNLL